MTLPYHAPAHPIGPYRCSGGDIISANGHRIDPQTAADLVLSWIDAANTCRERGRYATARLFQSDADSLAEALAERARWVRCAA